MHSHLWDAQELLCLGFSGITVGMPANCPGCPTCQHICQQDDDTNSSTFQGFCLLIIKKTGLQLQHLIPLFSLNLQAQQRRSRKSSPQLCCGQLSIVGPKARRRPAPLVTAKCMANWILQTCMTGPKSVPCHLQTTVRRQKSFRAAGLVARFP